MLSPRGSPVEIYLSAMHYDLSRPRYSTIWIARQEERRSPEISVDQLAYEASEAALLSCAIDLLCPDRIRSCCVW
jgi:hypothetical protein